MPQPWRPRARRGEDMDRAKAARLRRQLKLSNLKVAFLTATTAAGESVGDMIDVLTVISGSECFQTALWALRDQDPANTNALWFAQRSLLGGDPYFKNLLDELEDAGVSSTARLRAESCLKTLFESLKS